MIGNIEKWHFWSSIRDFVSFYNLYNTGMRKANGPKCFSSDTSCLVKLNIDSEDLHPTTDRLSTCVSTSRRDRKS